MLQTSDLLFTPISLSRWGALDELTIFTMLLGLLELTRPLVFLAQHQSSLDNALMSSPTGYRWRGIVIQFLTNILLWTYTLQVDPVPDIRRPSWCEYSTTQVINQIFCTAKVVNQILLHLIISHPFHTGGQCLLGHGDPAFPARRPQEEGW